MKRFFSILLTFGIFATVAGALNEMGVNPVVSYLTSAVLTLALGVHQMNLPFSDVVLNATVDTEVWVPRLVKNLFKNNEFLMRSLDDSQYVNNISVHKPQEAAGASWTKNRVWGAGADDATDRTDTILSYNIDEWSSDMMRVLEIDKVQLSYPKIDSVLDQMLRIGRETIADNMLYNWAATGASAANILRTSGIVNNDTVNGVVTSELSHVNGTAAGGRKVFGLYDLKRAFILMSKYNLGTERWVMVMSPNMYQELLDDIMLSKFRTSTPELDLKTGIVDQLMNFDIYLRTTTCTYDNTATPVRKAVDAVAAATDNDSVLFWSPSAVCRAIGETKLLYNPNQAAYGGDVLRAITRMGGSKERSTEIGVGAIVQDAA